MKQSADLLLMLSPGDSYEGVDRYTPNSADFYNIVRSLLPSDWSIVRESIWMFCSQAESRRALPLQGWKLHLSSDRDCASELLQVVVPVLAASETAFKFAADKRIHHLLNSKHWTRGGGGKFVTIYPPSETAFRYLADSLAEYTKGFSGPYILSDRRYRQSKVVYYRYGGFRSLVRVNVRGAREHYLCAPDGELVKDVREPYFILPQWVTDPFADEANDDSKEDGHFLQNGRFRIDEALVFTNAGGIYRGIDTTDGRKVLVKEARPFIQMLGSTEYAARMLKREYQMLQLLTSSGVVPKPIAYFTEWEHDFLVEEFIEGDTLARHSGEANILLYANPSPQERAEYIAEYYRLAIAACQLLNTVHQRGVVIGDISPNNFIVATDTGALVLIDLESASMLGEDTVPHLFTPGYSRMSAGKESRFRDDYFGLGSILASMLFPLNRLFTLDQSVALRVIPEAARDAGFPQAVSDIVLRLLGLGGAEVSNLVDVAAQFDSLLVGHLNCSPSVTPKCMMFGNTNAVLHSSKEPNDSVEHMQRYNVAVSGLLSFVYRHIDYSRTDRFFPASSEALWKNPYCLANGIAGLAVVVLSIEGALPDPMKELLANLPVERLTLPTGLFSGWAGISCVLWDSGLQEKALECAEVFTTNPLVFTNPFFENGLAGAGTAAIYLYRLSKRGQFLSFAEEAAEQLLNKAEHTDEGLRWPAELTDYGLGNGSSGIALFLLYLYQITGSCRLLEAGEAALEWDLAAGRRTRDDGLSWPRMGTNSGIVYPYWMHGSAGIGEVVVRYMAVTQKARYRDCLEKICRDTCRKYAVMPGLVDGLAGLGHFLLNCAMLLHDPRYVEKAHLVAEGLHLHLLRRGSGLAVSGDVRGRISCDYSTGAAGVAAFLNRFAQPTFMCLFPDELIHHPSQVGTTVLQM